MAALRIAALTEELRTCNAQLLEARDELKGRPIQAAYDEMAARAEKFHTALKNEKKVVARRDARIKELEAAAPQLTGADAAPRVIKMESSAAEPFKQTALEKNQANLFTDYCGRRAFVSPTERAGADPTTMHELVTQGRRLGLHTVECYLKHDGLLLLAHLSTLLTFPETELILVNMLGASEPGPAARVLQKVAAKEVFGRIQEHWDTGLSMIFKIKLKLSEKRLDFLSQGLTSGWNTHRDCFVRFEMAGVEFPALKGSKAVSQAMKILRDVYGVEQSDDGTSAQVSPETVVAQEAVRALQSLPAHVGNPRMEMNVMGSGDSFTAWKNAAVNNTTINMQCVPKGSPFSGLLSKTRAIMLYEGPDKRWAMDEHLGELAADLSDLLSGKEIVVEWEGLTVTVVVVSCCWGGDMPFKMSLAGLCSCNHEWGCLYCDGEWRKYKKEAPYALRTLFGIFQRAHRFHPSMLDADNKFVAFDCSCCGKTFSSREDLDSEPAITDEREAERYVRAHHGVRHHEALLVCGEMAKDPNATTKDLFKLDILHMTMSLTSKAMHETVGRFIETEEGAKEVNELLRTEGIMSTRKYTPFKQKATSTKEERVGYTGNTCVDILCKEKWKPVVARCTPVAWRERAVAVWMTLCTWFWAVKLPSEAGFDMTTRQHKTLLDETWAAFKRALTALSGPSATIGPYFHMGDAHMEGGEDIFQFSTQPSELRNKQTKSYLHRCTNHHPGHNGRLIQAMTAGVAEDAADNDPRVEGHAAKKQRTEAASRQRQGLKDGTRVSNARLSSVAFPIPAVSTAGAPPPS